jgi:hypothetical protein
MKIWGISSISFHFIDFEQQIWLFKPCSQGWQALSGQ